MRPPRRPAGLHDWNGRPAPRRAQLCDETLRDGLQSPSLKQPTLAARLRWLESAATLGIERICLGMPARGEQATREVAALLKRLQRTPEVEPVVSARMKVGDLEAAARAAGLGGHPATAYAFIAGSRLRWRIEGWSERQVLKAMEASLPRAAALGLRPVFVLEDATRTRPRELALLLRHAHALGAVRAVLCDTVGCATPQGTTSLVHAAQEALERALPLEWHGHDDRGLALANARAAVEAGCEAVHVTALGLGERVGNVALEQWLWNEALERGPRAGLDQLPTALRRWAKAVGLSIPAGRPVVGRDAFRTGSGTHVSAVAQAAERVPGSEGWVYGAAPAALLGARESLVSGPLLGPHSAERLRAFRAKGAPLRTRGKR